MNWSTLAFTRIDGRFAHATVPSTSVADQVVVKPATQGSDQHDTLPHAELDMIRIESAGVLHGAKFQIQMWGTGRAGGLVLGKECRPVVVSAPCPLEASSTVHATLQPTR